MGDDFDERLQELLDDNRSGSRLIATRTAELLKETVARGELSRTEIIGKLRGACRRLEKAHSGMRTIEALCDDIILILDIAPPEAELRERLLGLFERWDEIYVGRIQRQICSHAFPLIQGAGTIISHSYSSTVLAVFSELAKQRPKTRIIQSISAPAKEGLWMAHLLAEEGLAVELIADAGLAAAARRADAILVGADGVGLDGVVNKLGTLGLALAAGRFQVPLYAVFDSSKFLPPGSEKEIEHRDPGELASPTDIKIEVVNDYFDLTPLDLFTALINEAGALPPGEVRGLIGDLKQDTGDQVS